MTNTHGVINDPARIAAEALADIDRLDTRTNAGTAPLTVRIVQAVGGRAVGSVVNSYTAPPAQPSPVWSEVGMPRSSTGKCLTPPSLRTWTLHVSVSSRPDVSRPLPTGSTNPPPSISRRCTARSSRATNSLGFAHEH